MLSLSFPKMTLPRQLKQRRADQQSLRLLTRERRYVRASAKFSEGVASAVCSTGESYHGQHHDRS